MIDLDALETFYVNESDDWSQAICSAIAELRLARAVVEAGVSPHHDYTCSALRGSESNCHCKKGVYLKARAAYDRGVSQ